MSDPNAQGASATPATADSVQTNADADAHPGRVTVTMGPQPASSQAAEAAPDVANKEVAGRGPEAAQPHPSPTPAAGVPAAAAKPPPPRPAGLQALIELRAEVRDMRKAVDALTARVAPDADPVAAAAPDTDTVLRDLTEAVRTLEAYVSLTFFDRVRATLQEMGETDTGPAALERRLTRLSRLMWLFGGVQVIGLIILGLMIVGSLGLADTLGTGLETGLEVTRPAWGPVVDMLGLGAEPALSVDPPVSSTGLASGS